MSTSSLVRLCCHRRDALNAPDVHVKSRMTMEIVDIELIGVYGMRQMTTGGLVVVVQGMAIRVTLD